MQITLVQCSPRIMGERLWKNQVFFSSVNGSKRARMSKSQMKTTLIIFFDIKCTVHFEFVPQGQSVSQTCCVEILKRLHGAAHRKRPELWPSDWILHHDNAPNHKALAVKLYLAQKSITEMENPPHSPHLAPNDFLDLW